MSFYYNIYLALRAPRMNAIYLHLCVMACVGTSLAGSRLIDYEGNGCVFVDIDNCFVWYVTTHNLLACSRCHNDCIPAV